MISIYIGKQTPEEDNLFDNDDQYGLYACITVPEFASLFEANYAWFKSLELAGYTPSTIEKCKAALEKVERELLN